MSKKKNKKQNGDKDKIVYIDDNSTIADMSGTKKRYSSEPKKQSTAKEKVRTYFAVVKRMIIPMLVTLVAFTAFCLLFVLLAR